MGTRTDVENDWLGRRVVLRRIVGRDHQADALGDLIALDERTATVETRSGPTTIPRADIAVARLVEASPRDQFHLERIAERGWRAREIEQTPDGWLLRADSGWTGRANSALPLRTLTRPLDEVLAEVTAWYTARDLTPRIQVPLPAGVTLDNALAARGWTSPETTLVLVARLDLVAALLPTADDERAHATDELDDEWLDAYEYRGGPLPPSAQALLSRHPHVAFVSLRDETGTVIAHVRGAVDEGYLGITALGVRPEFRRQGLARVVLSAAVSWARSQGATRCYLQVSDGNAPALALYRTLGFHTHHSYRYRTAPNI